MRRVARALVLASAVCALATGCGRAGRGAQAGRPLGPPRIVPGELDASLLLGDLPARAVKLGAGPMAIVASGQMVEGERLGAFVEVPADVCLLAYGRGSSSVEDIDIAAFADEGNPIAVDEGPDPRPTLLLCPPHPDRVYVAAHVPSGEGLVALGSHLVPRERAQELARALGAKGGLVGAPRPAEAWPGLDDHVRAHRKALGGTWEELRRVAVTLDARSVSFVSVPIDADQCVDALVVPDDDVALLDVELMDGDGRAIARAREAGTDRYVTACSPIAFTGTLAIRPHVGRGLAAIVLGRGRGEVARDLSTRADVVWAAPVLGLDATQAARSAALAKAGYAAPTTSTKGALLVGRRTSVALDLGPQGAGCSRVDVVGGAPLALVEAHVWDDAGALVTAGEGADGVTLFACSHGKARLDLETRGRPGPFAVQLRKERWREGVFATHPLAAARMLSRAAVGPTRLHEGAATGARKLSLDAARMSSWETPVPAGQCLRVAVGVEGEGTGIDLRVLDAATGDELDRSHAADAASVRACAGPGAARTVKVEVRATSGKLDAIVGERAGP
jgi:hypothetical protein